ncbi:hypothetical protein ECML134_254 [Escherichia phage ECML-134]|uniref:Anti-restriction nuclease n=1 Tax=Escherichia phage ECML-134 TaxID=1204522 RepID=I7AUC6_9CAUD|nr:hypothetical protein ECML134_254 [Escherichia phage ECML-134]AFO10780.1 hypothetical protein ECML134_254 [Escherichia phage ECML-134]
MNIKQFQIDGIMNQIQALEYANKMMSTNWGIYTNEPAFQFRNIEFTKKLVGKDYVCPFSSPVNGMLKPALRDLYIAMNEEMIKELKRQLKVIQFGQGN